MNLPENKDLIDLFLEGQMPYVDDAGFTARVISSLPRRRRRFPFRSILLLVVVGMGAILAIRWLPWKNLPALDVSILHSFDFQLIMPWFLVVTVLAALSWAALCAFQIEE